MDFLQCTWYHYISSREQHTHRKEISRLFAADYEAWVTQRIESLKAEIEREKQKGRDGDPFKLDMLERKLWRYQNS